MPSNVIRSVVTPEGIITAHARRLVVFTPNRGAARQIVLPAAATSMLALVGPQQRANRLLVGDRCGALHVLMLPQMDLLSTHQLGDVPVTALNRSPRMIHCAWLSACRMGECWRWAMTFLEECCHCSVSMGRCLSSVVWTNSCT